MLMSTHGILMGVIAKLIHMRTVSSAVLPCIRKTFINGKYVGEQYSMWFLRNTIVCGFFGTSSLEGLKAVCSWLINSSSLNMWPFFLADSLYVWVSMYGGSSSFC